MNPIYHLAISFIDSVQMRRFLKKLPMVSRAFGE